MKKLRLLSFLGLLFTSVSLLAQTEQEARTVAMKFLQQKKGGASLSLTSAKLMDGQAVVTKAKGKSANAQVKGGDVYAFNAEGGGFAVVCTGNGNTAVAGYSDKGEVDVTCMPDAMKEWLASYSVAMTSTKEDFVQEPTWVGPTVTPVAPLLKTQWGQGAPFNRSEEHTSELQSRFDLVCRLLLEKKKKKKNNTDYLKATKGNNNVLFVASYR
mgnify:CR=1 FL=1